VQAYAKVAPVSIFTPTGLGTELFRGVAVVASPHEEVLSVAGAGSGAGKAGIAGSATVEVMSETTRAYIGDGSFINDDATNAGANAAQDVLVRASDETDMIVVAGAIGAAGTAGVGAGADVGVITKNTQAWVYADEVNARRNVTVEAVSDEDVFSVAAASAAGTAGVAGSGAYVTTTPRAFIGADPAPDVGDPPTPGHDVRRGDGSVVSADHNELDIVAGSISGAGTVGVGAWAPSRWWAPPRPSSARTRT
jgi:hypothetical protein